MSSTATCSTTTPMTACASPRCEKSTTTRRSSPTTSSSASRSAARSSRTACTSSSATRASRSTRRANSAGPELPVDDLPADLQPLANETNGAPFDEDLYFGKIDWLIDDDQLLELTVKYRTEDELTEYRRPQHRLLRNSQEGRRNPRRPAPSVHRANLAQRCAPDLRGRILRIRARRRSVPAPSTPADFNGNAVINTGGGRDYQDKGQKGWSVPGRPDLLRPGMVRQPHHQDRLQVQVDQDQRLRAAALQPAVLPTTSTATRTRSVPGPVRRGDRRRRPRHHLGQLAVRHLHPGRLGGQRQLTLNLGLRWDYEQTPGYYDYVTPAGIGQRVARLAEHPRGRRGLRHRGLHQRRQQPQRVQGRVAAAVRLLL